MNEPSTKPHPFDAFDEVKSGATFVRADLHVHSHGVSTDVTDETMKPAAIVGRAIERGIRLLAITDHNRIDAVEKAVVEGQAQGLAVIAGVELSTAEGHLLAYFDPEDLTAFTKWFNRLDFEEDEATGDRHLLQPMHEVASGISAAGGIAIPAHINRKSGCLQRAPAKSLDALIKSPAISAVEVDGPAEFAFFSSSDSGDGASQRKERMAGRAKALGGVLGPRLPTVYFSDAHSLEEIGRSRDGDERLTRIKMGEPSFESFKRALRDPEARIRLEADLPETYPRLIGARFLGGFLDGREIAFSPNLTCLIGGRGAGKSTALEAVRCACLSVPHEREDDPDSGWPDTVQLIYQDPFGEIHYVQRTSGDDTRALVDGEATPFTVPVEGYGQDRIAEIIRGYRDNPALLGEFLDGFTDLEAANEKISGLRSALLDNAKELTPIADAAARKAAAKKELADVGVKLKKVEQSKLKTALEWERHLAKERALRSAVVARLQSLGTEVGDFDAKIDTSQLLADAEISDLSDLPSKDLLEGKDGAEGLLGTLDALGNDLEGWVKDGQSKLATTLVALKPTLDAWEEYDGRVKARIAEIAEELREQGINPNMAELTKLAQVEADAKAAIKAADADLAKIKKLRDTRKTLIDRYANAQTGRYHLRAETTKRLTEQLNESLKTFKVKIAFSEGAAVDEYLEWLRRVMGMRIFKGDRPKQFCQGIKPSALADLLRKKSGSRLAALKDASSAPYFQSRADADEFIASLDDRLIDDLDAIPVSDLPQITLTVQGDDEPRVISFENLSFGQKASILLGALLFSEDDQPLIIDQPEDHLDSAFIFETVVSTLRRVKEKRQVILATHNANIAILGDAELLVPMQEYGGHGLVRDPGSVDTPETSKRACNILEGGTAAYLRRGEMYGLGSAEDV